MSEKSSSIIRGNMNLSFKMKDDFSLGEFKEVLSSLNVPDDAKMSFSKYTNSDPRDYYNEINVSFSWKV